MTTISCPGCARSVTSAETDIAACTHCGGVWMSNAAAQALVAGKLDAEELQPLARDAPSKTYREREVLTRTCPDCGKALAKTEAPANVELDVCSEHGVYFDRGELDVMQRFYAEREKQRRQVEYTEKRAFLEELHTAEDEVAAFGHHGAGRVLLNEIGQWLKRRAAIRRLDKEYKD